MNTDLALFSRNSPRIRFWDEKGQELAAPKEWQPCSVELCDLEDWKQHELCIQGKQSSLMQTKRGGRFGVFAELPRYGPGQYRLELFREKSHVETYNFTISPCKLSPDAFYQMLDELQSKLPHGIALSLEKMGGFGGVKIASPDKSTLKHEFNLLKRVIDGFPPKRQGLLKILRALADNPHRKLTTESVWIEAHAIRRISHTGMMQSFQRAGNIDKNKRPIIAPDDRSFSTTDTYENRVLLFLFTLVDYRLKRLLNLKTPPVDKIAPDLHRMLKDLAAARRDASFLDEVRLLENPPDHLSMVQMKVAPYTESVVLLRELTRILIVVPRLPALEHPLENTPELYQYWGTLGVIATLKKFAEEHGFDLRRQSLIKHDSRGWFVTVLAPGQELVHFVNKNTGEEIRCFAERTFSSAKDKDGYYSMSYQKRPDICIELRKEGEEPKLIIFDPKYKLISEDASYPGKGSPVRDDIDKMHTYRDAIRYRDGLAPVVYAAIIYPGKTKWFSNGLVAALGKVPGADTDADIYTVLKNLRGAEIG